ncbi:MAG: hypothetical protein AAGN15_24610 [Cyanobacteria bacterium J06581_3]
MSNKDGLDKFEQLIKITASLLALIVALVAASNALFPGELEQIFNDFIEPAPVVQKQPSTIDNSDSSSNQSPTLPNRDESTESIGKTLRKGTELFLIHALVTFFIMICTTINAGITVFIKRKLYHFLSYGSSPLWQWHG